MPPRYAYWTILVDDQPTAFRAGSQEDLMPTFKRLQAKHASAKMMWFQNGKLWASRLEAQDAMRARGEMGRRGDERQRDGFRDRKSPSRPGTSERKPDWKPRPHTMSRQPQAPAKLEWKPKGEFTPAPRRGERKPLRSEKPEWKPRGSSHRDAKPSWKPKGSVDLDRQPEWKPKPHAASRKPSERKLEWSPKAQASSPKPPEKRKWVPKEEYRRSQGIAARRDDKWRPGGEHKDPKQKYKDAKKAKWTRFKQTIRARWEAKGKKREK